ncbi:MAG: carbohydrate ABC transporter substrate-binding protein, partial [Microbacterium sp.]
MSDRSPRPARIAAGVAALALVGAALTGCSSAGGAETIRFTFNKREAIEFMTELVARYNSSQDKVHVEVDTSGVDVISASFVRGNPPDIMLANYNYEVARF